MIVSIHIFDLDKRPRDPENFSLYYNLHVKSYSVMSMSTKRVIAMMILYDDQTIEDLARRSLCNL